MSKTSYFHWYIPKNNIFTFIVCIYNHRTTKTNQKYPSVNL